MSGSFGICAGGEADHQIAPVPGERAQRRLGVAVADRIVHHVDAVLAAELLQSVAQIAACVVHAVVGAVLPGERELVVGRGAGDHAGAHQLAELDRGEAGAARGAEHRQRLAALQAGAILQRVIGRAVGDDQAGGAVGVEAGAAS